jgi:hypothetical protein
MMGTKQLVQKLKFGVVDSQVGMVIIVVFAVKHVACEIAKMA